MGALSALSRGDWKKMHGVGGGVEVLPGVRGVKEVTEGGRERSAREKKGKIWVPHGGGRPSWGGPGEIAVLGWDA